MSDNQKKILANLIKEDLQKEITEIKNIEIGNYAPICEVSRVAWEINGSTGVWVFPQKIREMADQLFPAADQPKGRTKGEITASNIGKKDFDEIISLIQQVNKLRQEENQKREGKRKAKLATNPNLFFYWGKSSSGEPGTQSSRRFEGRKDGKEFYLYIPVAHSALTNVSFAGQQSNDNKVNHFYSIEGFEIPTKVSFHDYTNTYFYEQGVELTDKIMITPYESETDSELSEIEKKGLEIKDCDVCQKNYDNTEKLYNIRRYHGQTGEIIQVCSNCYKNKEQEYLQNYEAIFSFPTNDGRILENIKWGKIDCYASKKDQSGQILQQQNCTHCQPWKQQEVSNSEKEKILTLLTQLFQKYNIKKITLKNGELVITNNNKTNNQLTNNSEYQLLKNSLVKINQTELTAQKLGLASENTTTNSDNSPSGNNYLWLVGVITLGVIVVGLLAFLLQRKKRKIN